MQVASNASAFAHSRLHSHVELMRELPDTKSISGPEQEQEKNQNGQAEPRGLVEGRGDGKIQQRTFLVPHAAVVRGYQAEAVGAWREGRVDRLATVAGILPIFVVAFQFVAELNLLRGDEAQSRVINREVANEGRQAQPLRRVISLAVGGDLLDLYRRRELVEGKGWGGG